MSANMPRSGEVATDETHNLISSDKVVGTSVYNRQGESLGSVYGLMLNKQTGVRLLTRSCRSAASWGWVRATIRYHGGR
jgi:hypothetical protein